MHETTSTRNDLLTDLLIGGTRLPWPADLLLLGARLYGGYTIASAGLDKLPVPDWMVDQVAQVGFPAVSFFALVACLTEFAGGLKMAPGMPACMRQWRPIMTFSRTVMFWNRRMF